ncbi:glycosyltransferase family 4 protein [Peribacillus sp. SCS-26]|uniref:glycosyltransferase family 4 protein n=1 Tax=Paraperibacillus marinus TaxID=3115295 RepID=UPI003905A10C
MIFAFKTSCSSENYMDKLEKEVRALAALARESVIHAAINGRLLEEMSSAGFQEEFYSRLREGLFQTAFWSYTGCRHPLQLLEKLADSGNVLLAAAAYSLYPLPLIGTHPGLEYQIAEAARVCEEVLHEVPSHFYIPPGEYGEGMVRMLVGSGFRNIYIHAEDLPENEAAGCDDHFPEGLAACPYTLDGETGREGCTILLPSVEGIPYGSTLEKLFPDEAAGRIAAAFRIERSAQEKEDLILWGKYIDGLLVTEKAPPAVRPCPLRGKNQKAGKSPLGVIMLSWEFPPHIEGGLARHVHGLAKAMAEGGHIIHIITAAAGSEGGVEQAGNMLIHRVTPLARREGRFLDWVTSLNLAMADKIMEICSSYPVHLVHAHDWLSSPAAQAAREQLGLPLAVTIHSTEYGRRGGIYNEVQRRIHDQERKLIQSAGRIIVCSDYMKTELREAFDLPSLDLRVIPNGISLSEVSPDLGDSGCAPAVPLIYTWGRAVEEKGFQTMIQAAAILKERNIKVQFVISGKGPYLPYLKNLVKDEGVGRIVSFTGFVKDKERNQLIKMASAAVFPSLYEPFGIVALEAMAGGKPIIISRTGGLKSIIEEGKEGLMFTPGDPVELAGRIEVLLADPAFAARLAADGKELAKRNYSWVSIAQKTVEVFMDLIIEEPEGGEMYEKRC